MRRGPRPAPVTAARGVAGSVLPPVSLLVTVLMALLLGVVLGTGTAAADVVVEPERVEPGARDATLVFRMTDEDPAADTVALEVFLPTGRPLVGVSAPPPPGWTTRLTTTVLPTPAPSPDGPVREVVSAIEWTAQAGPAPGVPERPEGAAVRFPVHVDLMPDGAGPVRFRVVQTDRSGRRVEWADTWAEGAPPPAHDALVLPLGSAAPRAPVPAGGHGDHHGDESSVSITPAGGPATPAGIATTVGGLLLFAAAVAVLAAGLGRRQRRRFEELTPGGPGEG